MEKVDNIEQIMDEIYNNIVIIMYSTRFNNLKGFNLEDSITVQTLDTLVYGQSDWEVIDVWT
jgi:hypothetical protein